MVNAHNFAEEPVEYSCRKDELPEADEMESERNAPERLVPLYSLDNSLTYIFRLQDRDDP